ncbi:hypothetical protein ANCDUO_07637 [Ancylostoma duodenale]|uniref:Uncharacterized protein n=1 Tax=Ancylostoma duodenale TaxID=51022 RepID=A0A0C2GY51_9BILA|nr:hypothetical protein ANCDUO_07637 [Ancylostoma duodenale]
MSPMSAARFAKDDVDHETKWWQEYPRTSSLMVTMIVVHELRASTGRRPNTLLRNLGNNNDR